MPINYCDRNFSSFLQSLEYNEEKNKRMRKRPSIVEYYYYLFTNYSLIITINHKFTQKQKKNLPL